MDVVSADGTHFTVTDEGHGSPVLIVHPGGGRASSWTTVARRLAARYRVLRFDRRPYRIPGHVAPTDTMGNEVNDVLAAAEAADEPVLLVGHSSGAVVALEAALRSPSLFVGLVLYEPPVAVTKPLGGEPLSRAQAALEAGNPSNAMRIHLGEIVELSGPVVRLMTLLPPIWRQMTLVAPGQIRDDSNLESLGVGVDRYSHVDVPVLLIGGTRSPRHLGIRLQALAEVLPHVDSVVVLKHQGHVANTFAPKRLARAIDDFAGTLLR
jgi:pimeloyl-ACP methyl ester carboxylesterase